MIKNTTYIDLLPIEEENLRQFIRGSLLGDGSIEFSSKYSKNARMKFCHGKKQKEYLQFKLNFLYELGLVSKLKMREYIAKSDRYKTGSCVTLSFNSKTHPLFSEYRNRYYIDKRRRLDKQDISNMNEFALSIWFMDDGFIWKTVKGKHNKFTFCTQSFTYDENLFLSNLLYDKWNIKSTVYKYSNQIVISIKDNERFINLIKPYMHNTLMYKLAVHEKSDELLENP